MNRVFISSIFFALLVKTALVVAAPTAAPQQAAQNEELTIAEAIGQSLRHFVDNGGLFGN